MEEDADWERIVGARRGRARTRGNNGAGPGKLRIGTGAAESTARLVASAGHAGAAGP
ncbi:unnamed protein product [Urochloa humidicola]